MGGGADARKCEGCGSSGGKKRKLLECSGCVCSFFCSTACQREAWPGHKNLCRKRRRAAIAIQSAWRGWSARRMQNLLKLLGDTGGEVCEVCGEPSAKGKQLDVCDGCKLSLFCSIECHRRGWQRHKGICRQRQRSAVKIQTAWRRRGSSIFICILELTIAFVLYHTWNAECLIYMFMSPINFHLRGYVLFGALFHSMWDAFNLIGSSVIFWITFIPFCLELSEHMFLHRNKLKRALIRAVGTNPPSGVHSVLIAIFLYSLSGMQPWSSTANWLAFATGWLTLECIYSRGFFSRHLGRIFGLCIDYARALGIVRLCNDYAWALAIFVAYWTGYIRGWANNKARRIRAWWVQLNALRRFRMSRSNNIPAAKKEKKKNKSVSPQQRQRAAVKIQRAWRGRIRHIGKFIVQATLCVLLFQIWNAVKMRSKLAKLILWGLLRTVGIDTITLIFAQLYDTGEYLFSTHILTNAWAQGWIWWTISSLFFLWLPFEDILKELCRLRHTKRMERAMIRVVGHASGPQSLGIVVSLFIVFVLSGRTPWSSIANWLVFAFSWSALECNAHSRRFFRRLFWGPAQRCVKMLQWFMYALRSVDHQ